MLTSPTALRDELTGMARDVGVLHTVGMVGFKDGDPRRVADNLAAVTSEDRWLVIDGRTVDADEMARQIVAARDASELVILVDASAPVRRPLAALIKAILDRRTVVDLTRSMQLQRAPSQSVYIIVVGASTIEQVPELLRQIPICLFVRPKR